MRVKETSSFRDPCGFIFYHDDVLYRQINLNYKKNYDFLLDSGLYKELVKNDFLVSHEEVNILPFTKDLCYKIIKPEKISFLSYPYEWCFSQLKDAAITTLEIQKKALEFGMILKDCSAYNVQFKNSKPTFIDTLSFEIYQEGQIWYGYKQFCQHFLAPLVLMSYTDIRLNQLLKIFVDGIPLDLTNKLLPSKTRFNFGILSHIHFHSKSQKHYDDKEIKTQKINLKKSSLYGIVENLLSTIKKLKWEPKGTEWADYYSKTNYSQDSFLVKKQIISTWVKKIEPTFVWDLGANTGEFSRITSNEKIETISCDIDPSTVEKNFLTIKKNNEQYILPLLLDLTNPSPNLGWNNEERASITNRKNPDLVFALALIHHLVISNNISLEKLVDFFKNISKHVIIEFIPKEDSQVKKLLSTRNDIFFDYDKENFELNFKKHFTMEDSIKLKNSERILYHFKRNT